LGVSDQFTKLPGAHNGLNDSYVLWGISRPAWKSGLFQDARSTTPHFAEAPFRVTSLTNGKPRLVRARHPLNAFAMISQNSFSDTPESSQSPTDKPNHYVATNPEAAHDAELVRRFNTGDEDAFPEIVARHRGRMFSVALGHLRNRADAEEIAQDTFIHAYRGLALFRGDSSLSSWLHRIAFNLSRNRCGYYSRRRRNETTSFDCALGDDNNSTLGDLITCNVPDPAREETNREFLDHVKVCMEMLNDRQREILTLRNLLDHSYEEIGKSLGLSTGTVKSRIARARKNLRTHLVQVYGEFDSDPTSSFRWFEPGRPSGRIRLAGSYG